MHAPTDENAKLLTALELLRSAAYKSFTDRREYEWKFCLSIWTVFTIYLSALVIGPPKSNGSLAISGCSLFLGTFVLSALVVVTHYLWTKGMLRANALNTKMEVQMTESMRTILNFEWDAEVRDYVAQIRSTNGTVKHWSHFAELLITFLLACAVVCAAWIRSNIVISILC